MPRALQSLVWCDLGGLPKLPDRGRGDLEGPPTTTHAGTAASRDHDPAIVALEGAGNKRIPGLLRNRGGGGLIGPNVSGPGAERSRLRSERFQLLHPR